MACFVSRPLLACALLIACSAPPPEPAAPAVVVPGMPWPHESSDLQPDPALQFARLPNGLRYVWQQHAVPPGRCSLRLIVHVGSADEAAGEEGMAHFVEHMAFNGTGRFPGNSVVEWLRQRGMAVGPDATAFTSPVDTTYYLDLPASDPVSLRDAFDVLCDMATRMAFDAAEVAAEKGVIDGEERDRSTPRHLAEWERIRRLGAGRREVAHAVLGTPAGRAAFTSESLRAFHSKWYRPDNMTLVVVGDVASADVPALVAGTFGDLPVPAIPRPTRADPGESALTDTRFVVVQPDRTDVEFLVAHPAPGEPAKTIAFARRVAQLDVVVELAHWMLYQLTTEDDAALTSIAIEPAIGHSSDSIGLLFCCTPARAEAAVTRAAGALAATLRQGFDAAMLEQARARGLRRLDQDVSGLAGARAALLANKVAHELANGRVPLAPLDMLAFERDAWTHLDVATATSMLRAAWPDGDPALVAIAPAPLAFDPVATWRSAMRAPSAALAAPSVRDVEWPYACPEPGPDPTHRHHDAGLGIDAATFGNGVRLLVKRTSGPAGEIRAAVCVGGGLTSVPEELRSAALLFETGWRDSGLGKLSSADLRSATDARRAGVDLASMWNAWCLRGRTDWDTLGFQLEWMRAHCVDPGWSQRALDRAIASWEQRISARAPQAAGELEDFVARVAGLHSYWPHGIDDVALDDLRRVFAACWRDAPLTLILAGDVDVEAAIAHVARTFGALPPRVVPLPPGHLSVQRSLQEERGLRVASSSGLVAIVAPLAAADVTTDRAVLAVTMRLLDARLRMRIREQLGASYHTEVKGCQVATTPPLAALRGVISAAPGDERRVLAAALDELARVQRDGCTRDEVRAAREIALNEADQQRATARGWVELLAETHGEPDGFDRIANRVRDLHAVTVADVQRVAARCLRADNLSTLVLRAKRQ